MSILLINPPQKLYDDNIWKKISSSTPPFGLALLAAILEKKNIDCDILDCQAENLGLDEIIKFIDKKKYKYVGLTSFTFTIEIALLIAKQIKKIYPKILIILGGVHASVFYKILIKEDFIDFIIRGEGEKALFQLVKGESLKIIKNLSYKRNKHIIHNSDNNEYYDLNNKPFLAYNKLKMEKYYSSLGAYKRKPNIGMITSRGCNGKCVFCYTGISKSKVRFTPAREIVDEIIYLKENYGIREISFYDDSFTLNKKNIIDLCNILINEKVNISWSCFSRSDSVDLNLLILMKKAGCHQIMFGIESADKNILNNINKNETIETNNNAIKLAQKANIDVRGTIMIGNPGETEETIKKTIDYVIKQKLDIVIFNISTPFPGTLLYKWAKKNNYLLSEEWSKYNLSTPLIRTPLLHETTIKKYYKLAYKKFYLRIKYFIQRLLKIKSFEDIKMNFNAIKILLRL